MILISTILIILLVPVVTAAVMGAPWMDALRGRLWPDSEGGESDEDSAESAGTPVRTVFSEVMEKLQVYPSEMVADSDDDPGCTFDFQGGHFVAMFREKAEDPFVNTFSISYFACYSLPAEHVGRAGTLANAINALVLPVKCSYTVNDEEGDISFSLHCTGMRLPDSGEESVEYMKSLLLTFFRLQRLLFERFEEMKSASPSDVEANRLIFGHQLYALSRMEMTENYPASFADPLWHPASLTIGLFVARMFDMSLPDDDMVMTINGIRMADNAAEIADTPLLAPVVEGEGADARLVADAAFISLRSRVRENREILISLRAEKIDDRLITVRVNAMLSALPVTPFRGPATIENSPEAASVILGVPCVTPEAFLAEAKYMADEMGLIEKCQNPDAAYCLYWGKLLYTDGRLLEADHYLNNAFSALSPKMTNPESVPQATCETFYDICYFLGVVNCALGRYQRAYYFLDLIVNQHRVMWTEQYVICLMALDDPRCPQLIANLLDGVRQQRDSADDSETDAQLTPFIEFLQRQQILLDIKAGETEKAGNALSAILADDPDNSFALFWLSKLKF